jgi:predicted lipid-binding transport protein (Tim44 family)/tellurite resistance protein
MSLRAPWWLARVAPFVLLLLASQGLARVGGSEHFNSGNSNSSGGGGGGGGLLVDLLIWLVIRNPAIGLPVVLIVIGVSIYLQRQRGDGSTRRAIDRAEGERRTVVSSASVANWTAALQAKDPSFELLPFLDRSKRLFVELQEAWFRRDLGPVRRHLSDATYQRLSTQLKLLDLQGVRDALADPQVLDLQLLGLEQTTAFDTVHVRVTATLRDDDAPSTFTDDQARAQAMRRAPERFVEVWSFVRKPGAQTKRDDDGMQGKCPNCGAAFAGGATNRCEFCAAIVNSGNYDWVVAEITQASEYANSHQTAEGLVRARQVDPALSTELLEDRASLAFWRWVEAQVTGDASKLSKLAAPAFAKDLEAELAALRSANRRKVFLECAVGSVDTRLLTSDGADQLASIEVRWSAKTALVQQGSAPPNVPSQPQRWVMVLQRKAGAVTAAENGMATNRCSSCGAPLSENGQPSCEFCGAALASGEREWVIRAFGSWEWWRAHEGRGTSAGTGAGRPAPVAARVPDRDERERLVYVMAAMAMADGVVEPRERQLLKMASQRWNVPWANVELALQAGPELVGQLLTKGSEEAEAFLHELVALALVDGKVDAKERKLLQLAALHLGLAARLEEFLTARGGGATG